jgi:[ribosomal protein S18]-alanine N-acetyltransferase
MNSTKQSQAKTACRIRWMISRDLPIVLQIETQSFPDPWVENDFIEHLRQRTGIGMVAEINGQVVGYMLYELHRCRLQLVSMAVDPAYRRRGIGRSMMDTLFRKLYWQRRNRMEAGVQETNLDAQLFFRACGLRVYKTDVCNETDETFYLFNYRVEKGAE